MALLERLREIDREIVELPEGIYRALPSDLLAVLREAGNEIERLRQLADADRTDH